MKAIEREKMYFFMLAVQTENPVLLVKSPLPKKNESNEKSRNSWVMSGLTERGMKAFIILMLELHPLMKMQKK